MEILTKINAACPKLACVPHTLKEDKIALLQMTLYYGRQIDSVLVSSSCYSKLPKAE